MTRMEMVGHVQFTIHTVPTDGRGAEAMIASQRIQELFATSRIPATWAIDGKDRSLIRCLVDSPQVAEIALQAPPFLMQLPTDRIRFERWLASALHGLREHAAAVTSLFVPHGDVADVSDILVGNGIRVVSIPSRQSRRLSDTPLALRPGLIRLALTTTLPGSGRILGAWDPGFRAKAALAHAMRRQSSQQIVLSMDAFLGRSGPAWRSLESVLRLTRLGNEAKTLCCETLREAAMRLIPNRARQPMQSILRAA